MEQKRYTLAEWARREEEEPEVRYEYVEGHLIAMAGGTPRHALMISNLMRGLPGAVRSQPCMVFGSDMRVQVGPARWRYPDVSFVCGEVEMEDVPGVGQALTNPTLLIEVLSKSSAERDLGPKVFEYLALRSLVEYWVVHPGDFSAPGSSLVGEGAEVRPWVYQFQKDAAHPQGFVLLLHPSPRAAPPADAIEEAGVLVSDALGLRLPLSLLYAQMDRL